MLADTVTYLGVTVLIGVTAAIASYIPARRAALANPIDALRAE